MPSLRSRACTVLPPSRAGETVKALVVLKPGVEPPTAEALMVWCHEQMAAYKVPHRVRALAAALGQRQGEVARRAGNPRRMIAPDLPGGIPADLAAHTPMLAHYRGKSSK